MSQAYTAIDARHEHAQLAQDDHHDKALADALEIAQGGLGADMRSLVSQYLMYGDWTPEQYDAIDSALIKIALGQPVAPEEIDCVITRGDIVELIARRLALKDCGI